MCEWGTNILLEVTIPAHLSNTGQEKRKVIDVDACIAPLVKALNDAGITTIASCCGHGKAGGNIILGDGRELLIMPNYDTARFAEGVLREKVFPMWPREFLQLAAASSGETSSDPGVP